MARSIFVPVTLKKGQKAHQVKEENMKKHPHEHKMNTRRGTLHWKEASLY